MKSKSTKNIFADTNILLTFEEMDAIFEETNMKERRMNGGKWKVSTEENKIFNSLQLVDP